MQSDLRTRFFLHSFVQYLRFTTTFLSDELVLANLLRQMTHISIFNILFLRDNFCSTSFFGSLDHRAFRFIYAHIHLGSTEHSAPLGPAVDGVVVAGGGSRCSARRVQRHGSFHFMKHSRKPHATAAVLRKLRTRAQLWTYKYPHVSDHICV